MSFINKQHLIEQIKVKKSFLCVGLDTDVNKIPAFLDGDIFQFNKAIVDATHYICVAYKLNLAFYLANGSKGMEALVKTVEYIRTYYSEILVILDAKFGDIGNSSAMYAKTAFETIGADAVTVNPYLGHDGVKPFLDVPGKWTILLGLTSNKGAADIQMLETRSEEMVYQEVMLKTRRWGSAENMMYVVGATKAEMLEDVREIMPYHFLLVPGVGAQGGSLEEVAKYGMNDECGLLVNSSRDILYASSDEYFAQYAAGKARYYQTAMEQQLKEHEII